jgi:hypothetical protein
MGKSIKRRPDRSEVRTRNRARPRAQAQIALLRLRQGCYCMCTGSAVAIPAAILAEHSPRLQLVATMGGIALLAGTTGLLLEVVEHRIFPGGENGA